jgi:hypothetical protein
MKETTKEQFDEVYDKYAPNVFLKIIYKHFSTKMRGSIGTIIIVMLFVIFNVLSIIMDGKNLQIRNIFLTISNAPFILWGLISLITFIWNKNRIKKIRKKLGLTIKEYDYYYYKWYNQD